MNSVKHVPAWTATAVVVCYAMTIKQSVLPILALFIPFFMSFETDNKKGDK